MKLKEIIYNFRELVKDAGSDDLKFTDFHLEFIINYLRSKLVRQDYQRNGSLSPSFIQTIDNLELEAIDSSGMDILYSGGVVLKSVKKIPAPIDAGKGVLLLSATGLDGSATIDIVPKSLAYKKRDLKYASKRLYGYYLNGHIYLVGCPSELRYINVYGGFENPKEISNFVNSEGKKCFDVEKDDYPISGYMIDMLNSLIKNQELDVYFQIAEDKVNDSQNNA